MLARAHARTHARTHAHTHDPKVFMRFTANMKGGMRERCHRNYVGHNDMRERCRRHAWLCVRTCVSGRTRACVCAYVCACVCALTRMHMCICAFVRVRACVCEDACAPDYLRGMDKCKVSPRCEALRLFREDDRMEVSGHQAAVQNCPAVQQRCVRTCGAQHAACISPRAKRCC